MPLHLLGISRSGDIEGLPIHGPDGWPAILGDEPVETISGPCCRGIQWVAHCPLAAATVLPLSAAFGPLEQAALLAAIHAHVNILPVRYGTVLPDEEAGPALSRQSSRRPAPQPASRGRSR